MRIRLASFNIQTGISTNRYREYLTGGWRHIYPSSKRLPNLIRIAQLLKGFDIVGLQEVDGGGLRSHSIVQTQYLAEHGGFPYWHNQINRRLGNIAYHSNGLLSRIKPDVVEDYQLPGLKGRGALLARYNQQQTECLGICVLHLALGKKARLRQLAFVSELIQDLPHVILMGDLNCEPTSQEMNYLTRTTNLAGTSQKINTFPSWQPNRMLDHILVTPGIKIHHVSALSFYCSDHLPMAMEVELPETITFSEENRQQDSPMPNTDQHHVNNWNKFINRAVAGTSA